MTPVLCDIRAKARQLVGQFRSSTLAKDKLVSVQKQLGRPTLKLLQEVETRWNRTYNMLQRLVDLREPVGAALASLNMEITTLTSAEFTTISGCAPPQNAGANASRGDGKNRSSSGQRNGRTSIKAAKREAPHTPINEHHVIGNATGP
ncbi:Zinc finger BED domain containing protein 4 [Dissostichus eleginoides]|uniref:Zinc finger BED domain containing protein 4 n=1 Tax=Dissostichus eleginoides TaxID=100907 RepID=A0AAD9EMI6_DISEL|nr:Zinc finger BED domain containing protein 4 [Dissostichus eleginoides]